MSGLDRICGFPCPRQEIAETVRGVAIGHSLQDIGEVGVGFDAIQLRGFDQRAEDGPAPGAAIAAGEQMVLAAKGHRPFILPMSAKSGKFTIFGIPMSGGKSAFGG